MARADVVEEEERPRAATEDVVDAVVHNVIADGIVPPEADSHADLGADAINAAHQDRSVATRGGEEATEAANVAHDLRAERERIAPLMRPYVSSHAAISTPAAA